MRKFISLGLSALFLVACTASQGTSVSVSKVLIGGELNARGEIEKTQTAFSPTQVAIFAHAFVEGHTASTLVRGEWWYDGGDEPKKIYEANVTVVPDRPVAMFTLQSTQQWPVGDYRFVMFLGDQELSSTEFTVESL